MLKKAKFIRIYNNEKTKSAAGGTCQSELQCKHAKKHTFEGKTNSQKINAKNVIQSF